MTVFNTAAHRLVFAKDLNRDNNEVIWPADMHAIALNLFMAGEIVASLAAPADTTKMWYQPHATNGANGVFKVFDSGAWQAVTSSLLFTWLRTRAGYNPGGGLATVAVTAPMTGNGTAGSPIATPNVTISAAGLMSAADKVKLDGLGASSGTNLSLANHNANTIDVQSDTGTDVTLPAATTALAGLMSAADKTKVDAAAAGWSGSNPPAVGALITGGFPGGSNVNAGATATPSGGNPLIIAGYDPTNGGGGVGVVVVSGTYRNLGYVGNASALWQRVA